MPIKEITAKNNASQEPSPRAFTTMNRQIGPSMLLSISIVCFFAIALYQHDVPKPSVDGLTGPNPKDTSIAQRNEVRPAHLSTRLDALASQINADEPEPEPKPVARRTNLVRYGLGPQPAPAHPQPGRAESTPSIGANQPPARAEIASVRQPDSAFTIVEPGETIADVSTRVYGTTSMIDHLRRANVDALATDDATPCAGMLLRTPRLR